MNKIRARSAWFLVSAICCISFAPFPAPAGPQAKAPAGFRIEEATIALVHAAMKAKQVTCRNLVAQYLKRIEADHKKVLPKDNAQSPVRREQARSAVRGGGL